MVFRAAVFQSDVFRTEMAAAAAVASFHSQLPACNPAMRKRHQRATESWYYVSPAGQQYLLNQVLSRHILTESGSGLPSIDYLTQRSPFQHGETPLDFFLRPRIIQLVTRRMFNGRQPYWDGRNTILDELRPNRQQLNQFTPGSLIVTLPEGSQRAIECFIESGPEFSPRNPKRWDEWAFTETLRFIAHNPIWYDPTPMTALFVEDPDDLIFPITFPIVFGGFHQDTAITYPGTWEEYPFFLLKGPLVSPRIENLTTGELLQLNTTIPANYLAGIFLSFGTKAVTLEPQPAVSSFDGVNQSLRRLDNASLDLSGTSFTFAAWVQASSLAADQGILGKWSAAGNREYLLSYDNAANRFVFSVSSDGTAVVSVQADGLGAPSTDTWYCIFVWVDGDNNLVGIQVNESAPTSAASSGVFSGSSDFYLGQDEENADFLTGFMGPVTLWKGKIFTYQERRTFYQSRFVYDRLTSQFLDQLTSWWELDELTGDRVDSHGTNPLTNLNSVGSSQPGIGLRMPWVNEGTNLLGDLSIDSDLASFHLAPDPAAPGGVNHIRIEASGTTQLSSITLSWYARYIGI